LWPNGSKTKPYVSSAFGPRNINVPNASKNHKGADFSHTFSIIRAVAAGQVKVAGTPSGWPGGGTQVWLQHDGFFSKSLHSAGLLVKVGQFVREGDPLCVMGRTGTASDVHLHLEITPGDVHYSNTGQVDPVAFLAARMGGSAAGGGAIPEEEDMPTPEEIAQAVWTHSIANKQGGAGAIFGRAADWLTNTSDAVANLHLDIASAVAVIRADLNYVHVVSPYSLKAILEASKNGTVQLTDAQAAAIAGQLSAAAVAGIDAALKDDFDGVKQRLAQLPAETIAALKAAL
jgi:hypothetical protein